jgi:hypothetical protein
MRGLGGDEVVGILINREGCGVCWQSQFGKVGLMERHWLAAGVGGECERGPGGALSGQEQRGKLLHGFS